jgi:hypothetical protein
MDIAEWLQDLGLERYAPAFRDNEIDERVLPGLTADDLKDLGVTLVGHRRRLLGHDVGLAQRMESLGESGHICLSEHTARLVEGYFQLRDLGRLQVKGVIEPLGVFDLEGTGRAPNASRSLPRPRPLRLCRA